MTDAPERRRFRFSLRTLFVAVTVAAVGTGCENYSRLHSLFRGRVELCILHLDALR
jgi:hypothetical protein